MLIILIIFAGIILLYVLSTVCRTGHKGLDAIRGWNYAHRGLHGDGAPENSIEAFRRAKEEGYGSELDVHLLADGNLAVMHDSLLKRTTGKEGRIEDLTTGQLKDYYLEGTTYTIPLLSEVLEIYAGAAPLIVEIKAVGNNWSAVCEKTCQMLDRYDGIYCLESFDPRCVYWLRKNRPDLIRGQLTEDYFCSKTSKLPAVLKFVLKHQMLNFITFPDFVAYRFSDRKTISNILVRKLWKAQGVTWTLQTPAEHTSATEENWVPIFENYLP